MNSFWNTGMTAWTICGFPPTGMFHRLGFRFARDALGAAFDYEQAFGSGHIFIFQRQEHAITLNYEAGYSFDDAAPVERWFELGGFARLSGLAPDQLSGQAHGFVKTLPTAAG